MGVAPKRPQGVPGKIEHKPIPWRNQPLKLRYTEICISQFLVHSACRAIWSSQYNETVSSTKRTHSSKKQLSYYRKGRQLMCPGRSDFHVV